jgi:hypothetical protein
MDVFCKDCEREFEIEPHEKPWRTRCYACWSASRRGSSDRDTPASRWGNGSDTQLQALRDKVEFLTREVERLRARSLSQKDHRLLLQLAHPDRHNGSPASVAATQLLLGMK